jgi:hypothetical protein
MGNNGAFELEFLLLNFQTKKLIVELLPSQPHFIVYPPSLKIPWIRIRSWDFSIFLALTSK